MAKNCVYCCIYFILMFILDICCSQEIDIPSTVRGSCGGVISNVRSGYIASPMYPTENYPDGSNCTYKIVADVGSIVTYQSLIMDLEARNTNTRLCHDYLEIYDGDVLMRSEGESSGKYCASENIPVDATSGNILRIVFSSDELTNAKGFVLKWATLNPRDLRPSFNCNFDGPIALCPGWSQSNQDNHDWEFRRSKTPTKNTGPSFDHTPDTKDGRFAYIEASDMLEGDHAWLISPAVPAGVDDYCLSFWYHMNGVGMGELSIERVNEGGNDIGRSLINLSGNKGDKWHLQEVGIKGNDKAFYIVFHASPGNSFYSDIAIDDIMLRPGLCFVEETTEAYFTGTSFTTEAATTEEATTDLLNCNEDSFFCKDGLGCLEKLLVCDRIRDCADGSDEDNCETRSRCPPTFEWQVCGSQCNWTCADKENGPPCSINCIQRCGCPAETPVLHLGRCIAYSECPASNENDEGAGENEEFITPFVTYFTTEIEGRDETTRPNQQMTSRPETDVMTSESDVTRTVEGTADFFTTEEDETTTLSTTEKKGDEDDDTTGTLSYTTAFGEKDTTPEEETTAFPDEPSTVDEYTTRIDETTEEGITITAFQTETSAINGAEADQTTPFYTREWTSPYDRTEDYEETTVKTPVAAPTSTTVEINSSTTYPFDITTVIEEAITESPDSTPVASKKEVMTGKLTTETGSTTIYPFDTITVTGEESTKGLESTLTPSKLILTSEKLTNTAKTEDTTIYLPNVSTVIDKETTNGAVSSLEPSDKEITSEKLTTTAETEGTSIFTFDASTLIDEESTKGLEFTLKTLSRETTTEELTTMVGTENNSMFPIDISTVIEEESTKSPQPSPRPSDEEITVRKLTATVEMKSTSIFPFNASTVFDKKSTKSTEFTLETPSIETTTEKLLTTVDSENTSIFPIDITTVIDEESTKGPKFTAGPSDEEITTKKLTTTAETEATSIFPFDTSTVIDEETTKSLELITEAFEIKTTSEKFTTSVLPLLDATSVVGTTTVADEKRIRSSDPIQNTSKTATTTKNLSPLKDFMASTEGTLLVQNVTTDRGKISELQTKGTVTEKKTTRVPATQSLPLVKTTQEVKTSKTEKTAMDETESVQERASYSELITTTPEASGFVHYIQETTTTTETTTFTAKMSAFKRTTARDNFESATVTVGTKEASSKDITTVVETDTIKRDTNTVTNPSSTLVTTNVTHTDKFNTIQEISIEKPSTAESEETHSLFESLEPGENFTISVAGETSGKYKKDYLKIFNFEVVDGYVVRVTFTKLNVYCDDGIQFYNFFFGEEVINICGTQDAENLEKRLPVVISDANMITAVFHTNNENEGKGFTAVVDSIPASSFTISRCGETFSNTTGFVSSPNFPRTSESEHCQYVFNLTSTQFLEIDFKLLGLEQNEVNACERNFIDITSNEGNAKICGIMRPEIFILTGYVTLSLTTKGTQLGFWLSYIIKECELSDQTFNNFSSSCDASCVNGVQIPCKLNVTASRCSCPTDSPLRFQDRCITLLECENMATSTSVTEETTVQKTPPAFKAEVTASSAIPKEIFEIAAVANATSFPTVTYTTVNDLQVTSDDEPKVTTVEPWYKRFPTTGGRDLSDKKSTTTSSTTKIVAIEKENITIDVLEGSAIADVDATRRATATDAVENVTTIYTTLSTGEVEQTTKTAKTITETAILTAKVNITAESVDNKVFPTTMQRSTPDARDIITNEKTTEPIDFTTLEATSILEETTPFDGPTLPKHLADNVSTTKMTMQPATPDGKNIETVQRTIEPVTSRSLETTFISEETTHSHTSFPSLTSQQRIASDASTTKKQEGSIAAKNIMTVEPTTDAFEHGSSKGISNSEIAVPFGNITVSEPISNIVSSTETIATVRETTIDARDSTTDGFTTLEITPLTVEVIQIASNATRESFDVTSLPKQTTPLKFTTPAEAPGGSISRQPTDHVSSFFVATDPSNLATTSIKFNVTTIIDTTQVGDVPVSDLVTNNLTATRPIVQSHSHQPFSSTERPQTTKIPKETETVLTTFLYTTELPSTDFTTEVPTTDVTFATPETTRSTSGFVTTGRNVQMPQLTITNFTYDEICFGFPSIAAAMEYEVKIRESSLPESSWFSFKINADPLATKYENCIDSLQSETKYMMQLSVITYAGAAPGQALSFSTIGKPRVEIPMLTSDMACFLISNLTKKITYEVELLAINSSDVAKTQTVVPKGRHVSGCFYDLQPDKSYMCVINSQTRKRIAVTRFRTEHVIEMETSEIFDQTPEMKDWRQKFYLWRSNFVKWFDYFNLFIEEATEERHKGEACPTQKYKPPCKREFLTSVTDANGCFFLLCTYSNVGEGLTYEDIKGWEEEYRLFNEYFMPQWNNEFKTFTAILEDEKTYKSMRPEN